jgi:hypothetical protein
MTGNSNLTPDQRTIHVPWRTTTKHVLRELVNYFGGATEYLCDGPGTWARMQREDGQNTRWSALMTLPEGGDFPPSLAVERIGKGAYIVDFLEGQGIPKGIDLAKFPDYLAQQSGRG